MQWNFWTLLSQLTSDAQGILESQAKGNYTIFAIQVFLDYPLLSVLASMTISIQTLSYIDLWVLMPAGTDVLAIRKFLSTNTINWRLWTALQACIQTLFWRLQLSKPHYAPVTTRLSKQLETTCIAIYLSCLGSGAKRRIQTDNLRVGYFGPARGPVGLQSRHIASHCSENEDMIAKRSQVPCEGSRQERLVYHRRPVAVRHSAIVVP